MTKLALPAIRTPFLDDRGQVNVVWFRYFSDLFNRAGGGENVDLGPLILLLTDAINQVDGLQTQPSDAAAQQALQRIEELQSRVEGLAQTLRQQDAPDEPPSLRDMRQTLDALQAALLDQPALPRQGLAIDDTSNFWVSQSAGQAIAASTFVKLNFATEVFDNLGEFNTTTSEFTALQSGTYVFKLSVMGTQPAITTRVLSIYVNGVERVRLHQANSNGDSIVANASPPIALNKGDVVSAYYFSIVADTTNPIQISTNFGGYRIK